MADWTNQDTNTLLPGEPWTSAKALAAFENPVAIAEGAPGAPRVDIGAFGRLVAGDDIRSRYEGASVTTIDAGYGTAHSFAFIQKGTIRCEITSFSSASARISRLRNGVLTVVSGPSATSPLSADVSVIPGDEVFLELGAMGGGGDTQTCNAYFKTGGVNLFPTGAVRVEGNVYLD